MCAHFVHLTQGARQSASLAQADAKLRSRGLAQILEPMKGRPPTAITVEVSPPAFAPTLFLSLHTWLKGIYV